MQPFQLSEVNFLAVFLTTLAYFFLGAIWYSPVLFGKIWANIQQIDMNDDSHKKGVWKLMAGSFLGELIIVSVMAYFIQITGAKVIGEGITIGILTALGFMGTTIAITFLYEGKPFKLYLIDIGYHLTGFLIAGILLVIWP